MKGSLRKRVAALAFACLLLAGGAAEALAQYRVRVYNPGRYNRTRQTMSNSAAVRAALKRKKQRQKARRKALRRTVG
jgi:spermidine/putrescine-binding protein